MVLYVYLTHLAGLEWQDFGRYRAIELGQSRSIRDYLTELDPAFEHLRMFTFSEAILENLRVYLIIGSPVAIVILTCERNRVRWLQSLCAESLPSQQAQQAKKWLECYLRLTGVMFMLILLIAPFHLDMPRAHYTVAAGAISSGFGSICMYLAATRDLAAVTSSNNAELVAWVAAQRWVRPVLAFVLALHGVAGVTAVWKAETVGDDWPALAFGIFETLLVLGYQLFQGVFVLDDIMQLRGAAGTAPQSGAHDKLETLLGL